MFPPNASGTSADRTSPPAGATPTVPCMGDIGRSATKSDFFAVNRHSCLSRSSCQIHVSSSSGSFSSAVRCVPVSAPNSGTVVDAAQSRAGLSDTKCTATVSPGSAPSIQKGPVCGLSPVMFSLLTRSSADVTRPAKQSSVYRSSTHGVRSRMTGAAPPKVQAYSPGPGRYVIVSRSLIGSSLLRHYTRGRLVEVDEAHLGDRLRVLRVQVPEVDDAQHHEAGHTRPHVRRRRGQRHHEGEH